MKELSKKVMSFITFEFALDRNCLSQQFAATHTAYQQFLHPSITHLPPNFIFYRNEYLTSFLLPARVCCSSKPKSDDRINEQW